MFTKTTTIRYCHVDKQDYFCMKAGRSPFRNNCTYLVRMDQKARPKDMSSTGNLL